MSPRSSAAVDAGPGLDLATCDLLLAALFVDPDPERLGQLHEAARACHDVTGLADALERHGVLGLVRRNLELAHVELPLPLQEELARREERLTADARRDRTTCQLVLRAAREAQVEVILLKGASLAHDVYRDPNWRRAGDLDVMVRPGDLRALLEALKKEGLGPEEHALPLWWYRLTHFHAKLGAPTALVREVELHWHVVADARLFSVTPEDLWERSTALEVEGLPARTLDALDRFVHVTTHLVSHWYGIPGRPGRDMLRSVLEAPDHPVRLKWALDVRALLERCWREHTPADVARRARDWNAAREFAWGVDLVRNALGVSARLDAWVDALLEELEQGAWSGPRSVAPATAGHRPLPLLDFRWRSLGALPRWMFPPQSYLRRIHAGVSHPLLRALRMGLARVLQPLRVGARLASVVALAPLALLGRECLRPERRSVRQRALAPERILDLVVEGRQPAVRQSTRTGDASGRE